MALATLPRRTAPAQPHPVLGAALAAATGAASFLVLGFLLALVLFR